MVEKLIYKIMSKKIYKYIDKYYSLLKILEVDKIAYLANKKIESIKIKKTKYDISKIEKVFLDNNILENEKVYSYVINSWGECVLSDLEFKNILEAKKYLKDNFKSIEEYGGVRFFFISEKKPWIVIEPTYRKDIFVFDIKNLLR